MKNFNHDARCVVSTGDFEHDARRVVPNDSANYLTSNAAAETSAQQLFALEASPKTNLPL